MIHLLHRLVVLVTQHHLALRGFEHQPLEGVDQSLGVGGAVRFTDRRGDRHGLGKALGGEEVRGGVVTLHVLLHEPVVDLVLGGFEVIEAGAFHAGELGVAHQCRQNVAAGGQLDAEAVRLQVLDTAQRVGAAGPDGEDVFALLTAVAILQGAEQTLGGGGEVGGVGGQVFFVDHFAALGFHGLFIGGHAVTAEGVILGDGGDTDARLAECHGIGNRVLGRVTADPEHIAVPVRAGDGVGHALGHDDALILLGDRQGRQRHPGRHRPHHDVGVVLGVGFFHQRAGARRIQLGVFIDDFDLAALDFHAAVGGVLEAHLHTHAELLGVGGQRAGETGDMGNTDGIGRLRKRRGGEGGEREGRRGDETLHRNLSLIFRPDGRLVVVMVPFNMTPDSPFRKRVSKKIPQTWNYPPGPATPPANTGIAGL